MSLEGLRAWIGVVERKLAMRTRVFLVLTAIAIGAGGAGIYLAIDAQESAVSETDLQRVRDELAGTGAEAGGDDVARLEAELEALRSEVDALRSGGGSAGKGAGGTGTGGSSEEPGGPEGGSGNSGGTSGGATVPQIPQNQKQLEELVEKAKKQAGP